eukprot:maker-scaffold_9-snap-gene-10.0-mRNA-1 protein AED:0.26 eAED:0.26 QI:0/0/0/0.28/1/1/7/0/314
MHVFPVGKWLGEKDNDLTEQVPSFVKVKKVENLKRKDSIEDFAGLEGVPLFMQSGAACFPHPEKDGKGVIQSRFGFAGEDSYSITPLRGKNDVTLSNYENSLLVLAVADGVYSWRRQGIDAGKYSRALVKQIQKSAEKSLLQGYANIDFAAAATSIDEPKLELRQLSPMPLLVSAEDKLKEADIKGSCTACCAVVDGLTSRLRIANLGDSGVALIRQGAVVFRTREQEHNFGYPFQTPIDSVVEAEIYDIRIFAGDIILCGSDGVFDNLDDDELEDIFDGIFVTESSDFDALVQTQKPKISAKQAAFQVQEPLT